MQNDHFPLHIPFKPSPSLVTWFIVDFLLLIVFLGDSDPHPDVSVFSD